MKTDKTRAYFHTDELEKEIWSDCIFVLDTSAILSFYFYSKESQQKIIDNVLKPLQSRLWIPSHVEFEYLKNRNKAIGNPIKEKYDPIKKQHIPEITDAIKSLDSKINDLKQKTQKQDTHPFIASSTFEKVLEAIDSLRNNFESFSKSSIDQIENQILEIKNMESNDTVLEGMSQILQIGNGFSYKKKCEILAESEIRYRNKIPPGYKDAEGKDAKDGMQRIGDLIIWFEIIEKARTTKKPIVFITNDVKEDWCHTTRHGNETRIDRPREELIEEIREKADVNFWMYSFPQFLYVVNKLSPVSVDTLTIDEAKAAAEEQLFLSTDKVRYDGIYVSPHPKDGYCYCLRFFEDGSVFSNTVLAERAHNITINANNCKGRGLYIIEDNTISFALNYDKGVVDYAGKIRGEKLIFDVHSRINSYKRKGRAYYFIPQTTRIYGNVVVRQRAGRIVGRVR
ncbi:PIN-like domain-containing protein [Azohydromonas caseinilytica]|uniref:PIN like domain-containing protein n=1 Tax=Azohydromonas caseinilytica TaxID=2728836 RepID=A0A848FLI9_9BURK|nr:PIN-like domain-containing protein [Azohydromonas caseinilytica]NML19130.1 hypothetical protein [Azohydromonas caseinilytica]